MKISLHLNFDEFLFNRLQNLLNFEGQNILWPRLGLEGPGLGLGLESPGLGLVSSGLGLGLEGPGLGLEGPGLVNIPDILSNFLGPMMGEF